MDADPMDAGGRKILKPVTWFFYSAALFAVWLVPLTTGFFYMVKISTVLFNEKVEYSVVAGIIVGLLLSIGAGVFYSRLAVKHME